MQKYICNYLLSHCISACIKINYAIQRVSRYINSYFNIEIDKFIGMISIHPILSATSRVHKLRVSEAYRKCE